MGNISREQNWPAEIYGENNANARVFFWAVAVYAPTTDASAAEIKRFYDDLSAVVIDKIRSRDSLYVIMGDFNAVLDHKKDVYNATRQATRYTADREFKKFVSDLEMVDPAYTIKDRHPKIHHTHWSRVRTEEVDNITYRRIDYILCNSTQGILQLHIDNLY